MDVSNELADELNGDEGYRLSREDLDKVPTASSASVTTLTRFELDEELYEKYNRLGKEQFHILESKGLDSPCWREAVRAVRADCKNMSHSKKQRLALLLNNCHLKDSDRHTVRCLEEDPDKVCIQQMKDDDVAFGTYTEFLHHVESICHFLRHEDWQEETEALIQGLSAASIATFERAGQQLDMQEQVLAGQERVFVKTTSIAEDLEGARVDLLGVVERVHLGLQEAAMEQLLSSQAAATEQVKAIKGELGAAKEDLTSFVKATKEDMSLAREQNTELATTIQVIHGWMQNAASAWGRFQSVWYLIISLNLCWVLTTVKPLRQARLSIFLVVLASAFVERYVLVAGGTAAEQKIHLQEELRLLTGKVCALILAHSVVAFLIPALEVGRVAGIFSRLLGFLVNQAIVRMMTALNHLRSSDSGVTEALEQRNTVEQGMAASVGGQYRADEGKQDPAPGVHHRHHDTANPAGQVVQEDHLRHLAAEDHPVPFLQLKFKDLQRLAKQHNLRARGTRSQLAARLHEAGVIG